ncbi:MAG: AAA family ATPase [Deltaproteobacteria bacterium]|nr:AAA family ATPase [Deltaproteobacteria bacterium]
MMQNIVAEAMSDPAFYPFHTESVEVIQTHISWVFIAGDEVFKVKKAVNFGFLDFTTREKRKFYCEEEVRLNRRLAPQVYLGVVEISIDETGKPVLAGEGTAVEYAVHMNKVPADRMLKKLLSRPDFEPAVITAVAGKLADFHRKADTGGLIDETGGLETVRRNHEENFSQTEPFIGITLSAFRHAFIRSYARAFLSDHEPLFRRRVKEHRIRDCHGDLHLEHIVVDGEEIIIFDCIEFNERFRFTDVAAETAFLAMDLDFNGYSDLSRFFIQAYIDASDDREISTLTRFYQCYYAFVRGKVTGFRLQDTQGSGDDGEATTQTAMRYFDFAFSYAFSFPRPTLLIMAGLMGSGKSVIAGELSRLTGAKVIRMDVIRKESCGIEPTERRLDDFAEGIYSEDFSRHIYEKALASAKDMLAAGESVIVDASFKRGMYRAAAREAADRVEADFFVLECVCSDTCARERLAMRLLDKNEASDGRPEIYDAQKADFESISECEPGTHLQINTEDSLGDCVDRAIAFLTQTP